jgi:hypothetical protein
MELEAGITHRLSILSKETRLHIESIDILIADVQGISKKGEETNQVDEASTSFGASDVLWDQVADVAGAERIFPKPILFEVRFGCRKSCEI